MLSVWCLVPGNYPTARRLRPLRSLIEDRTIAEKSIDLILSRYLYRLRGKDDLIQGLRQVIRNNICQDEQIFFRLRGAGLVRREGRAVLPRCQLYADYFRERLDG